MARGGPCRTQLTVDAPLRRRRNVRAADLPLEEKPWCIVGALVREGEVSAEGENAPGGQPCWGCACAPGS
jgi:hypothetical protein